MLELSDGVRTEAKANKDELITFGATCRLVSRVLAATSARTEITDEAYPRATYSQGCLFTGYLCS